MDKIFFGSVCSGIEAASVAWSSLGWEASWLSEIEKFPKEVLAHHYPETPNLGDMMTIADKVLAGDISAPDVIVGGTPCQSFSLAGLRGGLDDDRGQLTLEFVRLANAIDTIRKRTRKPKSIIVWENVPGVLSSKDNAFGCFIAALAGGDSEARVPGGGRWANAGYVLGPKRAVAWRVLDAQYFGLAQRRKRVFVVASARDGFCPAKVLFEFDGVRRDFAPSREAGQKTSTDVGASVNQTGFRKLTFESYAQDETASTMMARDYKSHTDLVAYGFPGNWIGRKPENGGNSTQFMHEVAPTQTATDKHGVIAFNSRQDPVSGDVFGSLDTCSPQAQAVCYDTTSITSPRNGSNPKSGDPCFTLAKGQHPPLLTGCAVRRLTPVECERLQGFPDNYTRIPWGGKPAKDCPDGHRYKALGNSMAVPVMRWIAGRINAEIKRTCNG